MTPLLLRVAVRLLPAENREEVLRELLEQHRAVRQRRGAMAAWWWRCQQPLTAFRLSSSAPRGPMANGFLNELVTSQRTLRRRPALALTVIATIAISIGAIAAIASVIDAVLLRPLPFPSPDQLVWIGSDQRPPESGAFDPADAMLAYANPLDVVDWAAQEQRFAALAPFETFEGTVRVGDRPRRVDGALVGADMANVLRLPPLYGRLFVESDFKPAPDSTVLSHELWLSAFGGDPGVVGRTITLNDEPIQVIGVLPDLGMSFPVAGTDLWLPLPPLLPNFNNRGGVWQRVIGRMDPGVSVDAARADLQRVASQLTIAYPKTNENRRTVVVPLHDALVGSTRAVLWLLGSAVGLVLLIACANVGHLLLISAHGRRREMAVRAALGAAPRRLARLLVIESAWLALIGGVLGLLAGQFMLRGFLRLYPEQLPAVGGITLGVTAFAAAFVAILIAAFVAVVPSLIQARSRGLRQAMVASERGTDDRAQRRVRAALVVTQVALSTALLMSGGVLVRTLLNMQAIDPGFSPKSVLTFNVALSERQYPRLADEVRLYNDMLTRVRSLPGVTAAGTTTLLPLTPGEFGDGFYRVGVNDVAPNIPVARLQNVMPGYFEAIGLPIKAGRTLLESDTATSQPVVVVNEALQRKYFPDGALGQHMRFRGKISEIVGVVADKHHRSLRDTPRPDMYFPRAQVEHPRLISWVAVRTDGDAMSLLPAIRRDIEALDAGIAVDDPRLMVDRVDEAIAPDRFRAVLIGALAIVALLLAAIGLYGLIAHAVARDARDIAIRMALGAGVSRAVSRVLRSVLLLSSAGIAIGVLASMASQQWLSDFLLGVSARDPLTTVTVVVGLLVVAVLAAAGPARRASRVDPLTVLRNQ
jgi:predicted permease